MLQGIINLKNEGLEKWEFDPEPLQNINNNSGLHYES